MDIQKLTLHKINEKSEIYEIDEHPNKILKFVKHNEIIFHEKVFNVLGPEHCPKIYDYGVYNNKNYIIMEEITGMNISDLYGENAMDVPVEIFNKIRILLQKLHDHKIDYIDITGYNFIQKPDGQIVIIDFEHCIDTPGPNSYHFEEQHPSWYLHIFLNGVNNWDPEYA